MLALWRSQIITKSRRSLDRFSGATIGVINQQLDSRGSVLIASRDATRPPKIRFNFLESERDRRTMVSGVGIVRRLAKTSAMSACLAEEVRPGSNCCSDDQIVAFCRET